VSKLGSPAIPTLRTNDVKAIQQALNAIGERLRQIEAALGVLPGQTGLFEVLNTQANGLVVKADGLLVTRKLTVGSGLNVDNPTGAAGNPKVNAQVLADLTTQPDGFVVKTGSDAVTRVLIGGSGSGITIAHPDGVAGDPSFSTP